MADIFVSYARDDEPHADAVADALRRADYSVWKDDQLPAHRAYADVIQERLAGAKAVLVLWSEASAKSQWVRAEADVARAAGTLVQATLDASVPPLPFNQIQCADLSNWDGAKNYPGWRKVLSSIAALTDAAIVKPEPGSERKSSRATCICVLPFENMSGDPEQEYFSDGISEDITTDLSKISALGVTARNTAFTFKGRSVNVCEVARRLGVTHVLEGSVRKAGDRVRITAQLIEGQTGEHVWAERYDRELTDIFMIQDEISKAIVQALKIKLLPTEKKAIEQRGTTNVEAYKWYLLARQYWVSGNYGDIRRDQRVMRIASKAVQLDPRYADAWALLGNAQSNLRYAYGSPEDDGVAAAHAALTINPRIAEAHCPMIRRLEARGDYAGADAELEKALNTDRESWEVNKEAARAALRNGRLAEAANYLEKAVSLMETDIHAWATLVSIFHALKDNDRKRAAAQACVTQAEEVLSSDPGNGAVMSFGARGLAALGKIENAREWMARALLVDFDNLHMRYSFACMLSGLLGEKREALNLLQRVFQSIDRRQLALIEADPDLELVRDQPEFLKMADAAKRRLGLAPTPSEVGTLTAPFDTQQVK